MMLRVLLVIVLSIVLCVELTTATCTLKFNKSRPGLFVSKTGIYNIVLNPANGTVLIPNNATVTAYCSTGFKNYAFTTKLEPELKFSCSGTTVRYQTAVSSITYSARNDGSLECENEALYYTQSVGYCKNTGLTYGFNIGNTSVSFANICYDFKKMHADFVHYVPGERNDFVEDQFLFNPSNISSILPSNKIYSVNDTFFLRESQALPSAINRTAGIYTNLMDYRLNDLVPIKRQADVMKPYVTSFQTTTAIAWWSNLLDFNWDLVQNEIAKLSGWYDVYAGTSDDVIIPYSNRNVTFTYMVHLITKTLPYVIEYLSFVKVNQTNRTVPLYVWSLVKNRTDKKDTGVVIIGVNSPFFVGETSKTVLCKDMCDKIAWMSPLKNTRKIASMGYVFCCSTLDVKKRLYGFPQI